MIIDICYQEFLDNLLAEKNVSNATITSYETDFKILKSFLQKNDIKPLLSSITTPILRRYVSFLKVEKGYKTSTIRRKINSLSSFYNFLMEQEYIEKNPMLPIKAPKKEQKIPIYITEMDLKLLLEAPKKYARFESHVLRDTALLKMLIYTGARRSEVLSMNWDDVDFGQQTITIRKGKGGKERIVPLHESLSCDLWEYLQTRLPLSNQAIFISDKGTRMSISNFQTLFRRYLRKSGLEDKGYTIHKCRHSFASLLHQNGVDLLSIKELLGHEDLNSTNIYTHTSVSHLKKEVDKFPISL
ncbi:tyrosine-type recombinase/integrase [Tissierella praeacuta]|uniref:tyrosine-type recombinase/integrase n=1 Tax=Tissierella praeacuta TaxID=43131 RepID=UPI003DA54F9F